MLERAIKNGFYVKLGVCFKRMQLSVLSGGGGGVVRSESCEIEIEKKTHRERITI